MLPGADEFLPALILLVKRVNPPNIYSNLEFVQVGSERSLPAREVLEGEVLVPGM